jgi:predicted metal-dependent hydrolase
VVSAMVIISVAEVIRSKRRTLSLEIGTDAKLILRVPLQCPDQIIYGFLENRTEWIIRTQKFALEHCKQVLPKKYIPGEHFLYRGKNYELISAETGKDKLLFNGDNFVINPKQMENARELFCQWYQRQALKVIKESADRYSSISGITYHQIVITNAKHRWGSCSPTGNLNFTWSLVMAPPKVIDCVVVHELVHIEIKGHHNGFWERVRDFIPEVDYCRAWLNENQNLLSL